MTEIKSDPPIEKLTYEEAFQQLEGIVKALETGDLSLESAMELFELGQALIKRCMELLETAELRVKQVTEGGLADFNRTE